MKNLLKAALLVMFIIVAQPSDAKNPFVTAKSNTMDAAEAQRLISRLEEIKAMDKTNMTKSEKRALRKEVRASQNRLESSGVYLSVGAVIIIILLLILLL